MNLPIFDILNKEGIELKPGQIVWFHTWDTPSGSSEMGKCMESYINSWHKDKTNGILYKLVEMKAPVPELGNTLVARRFNIGSLGKFNIVRAPFSGLTEMVEVLSDISSTDDAPVVDMFKDFSKSSGIARMRQVEPRDIRPSASCAFMEEPDMENPPKPCSPIERKCNRIINFEEEESVEGFEPANNTCREEVYNNSLFCANFAFERGNSMRHNRALKPDAEDAKDRKEVEKVEQAKEELVKKITAVIVDYVNATHQMPPMQEIYELVKGKVELAPSGLSRLVVNDQLKIFLPDYNGLEVTFRPLPLTIYILFLRHLEGIVLNYIGEYGRELEEIYSIVMPNRQEKKAYQSLKNLTDTLSGSLNQKIAIIKRTFKANILNEETASKYYISGSRGEAYKISLSKDLIKLPSIFN